MTAILAGIGTGVIDALSGAGRGLLLLRSIVLQTPHAWRMRREILEQMQVVAIGSMPMVIVTSVFVGAVTAVQAVYQMQAYVPMKFLGTVISKSVFIELGPVLMALVVGSRLCANYAAELGTMKVTEQLDAMTIMAIDPDRYLAMPRFWAAVLMIPVVTIFCDAIAIIGGYVASVATLDVSSGVFIEGLQMFYKHSDLLGGLIKSFFFGGIIAMSGIYYGFNTKGGAEGVGRSTMTAVVGSCLSILVADYLLAIVLFQIIFEKDVSMQQDWDIPPPPDQRVAAPASFNGIVVEGLSKSFGPKMVLDDCDLLIHKGETIVIIGRSGEGKSVLLKHIVRLLEPDAGRIWVEGSEVGVLEHDPLMELRKKFGFLFQGAALFDSMTIGKNIALALEEHTDWPTARIRDRVHECLKQVGLEGAEGKLPSELSGGMKKRAGLARAIVMEPQYIMYDEPTTGLDPITSDAINDLIIQLQKELGVTSIVVTHDMPSAFKIGDRMAMLSRGRIVFTGTVDEVRTTPHPMVRQFIEGRSQGPLGAF